MNKYIFPVFISVITLLSLASQISYAQYQPPTYPTSLINPTYQVGTLPGSLGISSKGSAIYTIPLTVPPGTAGMIPSLSISYNSHHRNGILGMGWNLIGLSEITRVPLNYYFDGTTKSVDLTLSDAFALDSMRLILVSGTHGMDGAEYATEIESFNKIIAHGTAGNGPAWFEVKTKNGTTIEYGNSDFSRVEPLGSVTPFRWRVNKITDQNGNYMTFQYNEESGESTITSIIYTGNTSAGLTPYNTVEFNYLFRDGNYDPSFQYIGGGKVSQVKLLTSIIVKTNGGST